MVRHSQIWKLMVLMVFVSGCQKAKMTHRRPMPQPAAQPPVVHTPDIPTPIPQEPEVIPLPPIYEEDEPEEEIVIGPDPEPPVFEPSPHTPIEDDGEPLDPDIFSQNQQEGVRPDIKNLNVVEWFDSGYVKPGLKKCGPDCEPASCSPISLPDTPITDKIDILFIVDTSASLREERSLIASEMGAFIDRLKPNVDYQIAVMPAHGPKTPKSPHNLHGELFSLGGSDSPVIRYRGVQGKRGVIEDLRNKMLALPKDSSFAQGEVGLLGLYRAMTTSSLTSKMKREGFLRSDAALAVIFVADENDVCYDYDKGGTPHYDGSGKRDPVEQRTYDGICKINGEQRLTPGYVLQALKTVKGEMPIILTGVLYTSNNIPQKSDKYAPENEMGRGYLDLIRMGHGQAVNLADKNFGGSLASLGNYSQFRMEFENTFICKTQVNPDQVDLNSFEITVSSKNGQTLGRFSSSCSKSASSCPRGFSPALAEPTSSGQQIQVYLSLDQFQKIAEPSAVVRMSFKTKP